MVIVFIRNISQLILILSLILLISCVSHPPLPPDITFIEPSPHLPLKLSAFVGIWKGQWWQSQDTILVVKAIDSNYAEVIFSLGLLTPAGITPENSFYYEKGEVINDYSFSWNTSNGNRFVFEMQDGLNKVKGYFFEGSTGAKLETILVSANARDFSSVIIHGYPYHEYSHPLKSSDDFDFDNIICWKKAEEKTELLSMDIKRFKMWEEVNRCLREDYGWKLGVDDELEDISL